VEALPSLVGVQTECHVISFPPLPIIGNDSKVDGLVNFEKLRMIAKEIRHVGRMASVNMDPALMFRTRCVSLSSSLCGVREIEFRDSPWMEKTGIFVI
jgi:hypothetical protein